MEVLVAGAWCLLIPTIDFPMVSDSVEAILSSLEVIDVLNGEYWMIATSDSEQFALAANGVVWVEPIVPPLEDSLVMDHLRRFGKAAESIEEWVELNWKSAIL